MICFINISAISFDAYDISFISEIDIITIFGNLYDNAIEAAEQNEKDRYIKTAIYRIKEMMIIRMENSCNNKLEYINNNNIKSTKSGHSGIGLKNVNGTIKKYNGIFNIHIINGKCTVIISIPIK